MKHLSLFCCAMLQFGMSANAWSWPGVEYYLDGSRFDVECHVPTAASDDSDAAGKDEKQTGEGSEEEEPDCD